MHNAISVPWQMRPDGKHIHVYIPFDIRTRLYALSSEKNAKSRLHIMLNGLSRLRATSKYTGWCAARICSADKNENIVEWISLSHVECASIVNDPTILCDTFCRMKNENYCQKLVRAYSMCSKMGNKNTCRMQMRSVQNQFDTRSWCLIFFSFCVRWCISLWNHHHHCRHQCVGHHPMTRQCALILYTYIVHSHQWIAFMDGTYAE